MTSEGNALGCVGFRCLDRDECYHYDANIKQAAFIHDGATCESTLADTQHQFQYHNLIGDVQMLNADEVQELMKCTYTSKLLFQCTHLLRNYAFRGFSDLVADGFEQFAPLTFEVSPKVAIGHVSLRSHVEEQPLGLFAAEDLACYEFLGDTRA